MFAPLHWLTDAENNDSRRWATARVALQCGQCIHRGWARGSLYDSDTIHCHFDLRLLCYRAAAWLSQSRVGYAEL